MKNLYCKIWVKSFAKDELTNRPFAGYLKKDIITIKQEEKVTP